MNYRESFRDISIDTKTILQFLNGNDISDTVINFYSRYIFRISELTVTDSEHSVEVKYIDRDLMQELYLSILECLPNLRKNIIRHLDTADNFSIKIKVWKLIAANRFRYLHIENIETIDGLFVWRYNDGKEIIRRRKYVYL